MEKNEKSCVMLHSRTTMAKYIT